MSVIRNSFLIKKSLFVVSFSDYSMIRFSVWALFFLFSSLLFNIEAQAQTTLPEAGQLLERFRPQLPLPSAAESSIQKEIPKPKSSDEATIRVMQIRITGSSVFTEEELRELVIDAEFRELTLSQLQAMAERITTYYRERGYLLARAYLPAQNINAGLIELMVVEGRLGKITERNNGVVGGAALEPLTELKNGEVAQNQTLERSLLLLSDLPGVVVTSTLVPGSVPGSSDLIVDVAKGAKFSGSVDVDANGDRYTGPIRTGGTLNINNPFRIGDQATLRGKFSEGLQYFLADYRVPINSTGMRVGASVSGLNYELGDTLASLGYKGQARTVSVFTTQPMTRSRRLNVNAELQFDRISLQDQITTADLLIDKNVSVLSAGLNGDWMDDWSGAGNWSMQYNAGRLSLDAETAAIDASGPNAAGNFGKLSFALRRLHGFSSANSLLLSVNGQIASKNLDSSQKMSLGGAYGVRAYPQGEGLGDQGYVATAEIFRKFQVPLPGVWQGSVFVDRGAITVSKEPFTSSANSRTLTGGGFGFTVALPGNWSLKSSIAWRIGSELPKNDVDRSPRGWLQMVKGF
jgi:hemolysin activation/secretion protein